MSQKEILKDHKRIGKRFVPPLMQLGIQEVSYINKLLPEIIWMGLVFDRIDYRAGVNLCEKVTKLAHEIYASEKHANFALCGSFLRLEDRQKEELDWVAHLLRCVYSSSYNLCIRWNRNSPQAVSHPSGTPPVYLRRQESLPDGIAPTISNRASPPANSQQLCC